MTPFEGVLTVYGGMAAMTTILLSYGLSRGWAASVDWPRVIFHGLIWPVTWAGAIIEAVWYGRGLKRDGQTRAAERKLRQ